MLLFQLNLQILNWLGFVGEALQPLELDENENLPSMAVDGSVERLTT